MRRQKVVRLLSPIFLLALIFGLASVFVSVSKAQQDSTSEPEAIDTKALIKEVSEIVLQPEDVVEERLDFKNVSVITEDCNYLNSLDYVSSCAKLTDDIAVAYFNSTADTAKAFLELREHYGGDKILLDHAIKTETLNTYVGYNIDEYYGWGSLGSTGLLEYANEIANSGNNTTLKVAVIDTGINASHIAFDNEGITRLDTESGRSFVNLAGGDNEVWSFGEEAYPILAKYMHRREALRPYVRELMHRAHTEGTPLLGRWPTNFRRTKAAPEYDKEEEHQQHT